MTDEFPKMSRSPERLAWDKAINFTNGVAGRFLRNPPQASQQEMDAAFERESQVFQRWGGPKG